MAFVGKYYQFITGASLTDTDAADGGKMEKYRRRYTGNHENGGKYE